MSEVGQASGPILSYSPFKRAFLSSPKYRFIQVTLQENLLRLLSVASASDDSTGVATSVSCLESEHGILENLGRVNNHIGYVYLLSGHLKG